MFSIIRPRNLQALAYLIIVSAAIIFLQTFFPHPQTIWLMWTVIFLSLALLTKTKFQPTLSIGLFLATTLIISFLSFWLVHSIILSGLYLFLMTTTSVYLGQQYRQYFYLFLSINLLAILFICFPASSLLENQNRILFILLGIIIVTSSQVVLFPFRTQRELQVTMGECLQQLKLFTQEMFSCLLQPEYSDNIYLFERRLHLQKNKFLQIMGQLRELMQPKNQVYHQLNLIFDCLLAIGQLRNRVSDYTILSVCKNELNALAHALENIFLELGKINQYPMQRSSLNLFAASFLGRCNTTHVAARVGSPLPETKQQANKENGELNQLQELIKAFESVYQNVLRVTSNEPLVFLLFIFDLKTMDVLLKKVNVELNQC